jgi:CheY-like chemotaxis protein
MREIKARYGWPGIALSGFGMDADMRDSAAAGFVSHLIKPVDFDSLSRALAAVAALQPDPAGPPRP